MSRKVLLLSALSILLYALILFLVSSSFATRYLISEDFSVDKAEKVSTQKGIADDWLIYGAGFDDDTRVMVAEDSANIHALAASVSLSGAAFDLAVINEDLYVVNQRLGLQVLNIENPRQPRLKKVFPMSMSPVAISHDNGRLYLSCTYDGVRFVDLNKTSSRENITVVKTEGTPLFSQASGQYLYVAAGEKGVQILNMEQGPEFKTVSVIRIPGKAINLRIVDETLFVSSTVSGVLIYNVSDPQQPELIETVPVDGQIHAMTVEGDTLYLGSSKGYISSFDIHDPARISPLAEIFTNGSPRHFSIEGERLYVADALLGLQALDIKHADHFETAWAVEVPGQARSVAIHNGFAYVASNKRGLQVVDINALEDESFQMAIVISGQIYGLLHDGEFIFIAGSNGLHVVQRSAEGALSVLASLDTEDIVWNLVRKGDALYLAEGRSGVRIVDISDPRSPQTLSRLELGGIAKNLAFKGNRLVVANANGGICLIDIVDPSRPWLVDQVSSSALIRDVAVEGDYIYAAGGEGVQIYELIDEQTLVKVGLIDQPWPMNRFSTVYDLSVRNGLLYSATGEAGLQIIDVQDPENAKIISTVAVPGVAYRLYLEGEQAFVADSLNGTYLIDISQPTTPHNLGKILMRGLRGVLAFEDCFLIADKRTGLREIIRPRVLEDVIVEDSVRLRVTVPYQERAARYSLHVSNPETQVEIHKGTSFSALH